MKNKIKKKQSKRSIICLQIGWSNKKIYNYIWKYPHIAIIGITYEPKKKKKKEIVKIQMT